MGRKLAWGIGAMLGMLMLILDSGTALSGALEGIELCLGSVIPTIFPFLVLSGVLIPVLLGAKTPILHPVGRFLRIPSGCEGIFLAGILGGYPIGARSVAAAWDKGLLSKQDARRMLGFCSNAGPAFLFGILGTKFPEVWMLWLLWCIHICSAIAVAVMIPGRRTDPRGGMDVPISFMDSFKNGIATMALICGWVILFRLLNAFLDRWVLWVLPQNIRVCVYGLLELANGCCSLGGVSPLGLRFVAASGMLAFGGLCVTMQTASVCGKLGLGMYLPGKILQAALSMLMGYFAQYFLLDEGQRLVLPPLYLLGTAAVVLIFVLIQGKLKIRGRNSMKISV